MVEFFCFGGGGGGGMKNTTHSPMVEIFLNTWKEPEKDFVLAADLLTFSPIIHLYIHPAV